MNLSVLPFKSETPMVQIRKKTQNMTTKNPDSADFIMSETPMVPSLNGDFIMNKKLSDTYQQMKASSSISAEVLMTHPTQQTQTRSKSQRFANSAIIALWRI